VAGQKSRARFSIRSRQKKRGSSADVRLLLDSHAFLWWLDGDRRLSIKARRLIAHEANAVLVSAASAWEITTKARLGKLPGGKDVAADVLGCIGKGFAPLDITVLHAQRRHPINN